jgi:hypothetical protein
MMTQLAENTKPDRLDWRGGGVIRTSEQMAVYMKPVPPISWTQVDMMTSFECRTFQARLLIN